MAGVRVYQPPVDPSSVDIEVEIQPDGTRRQVVKTPVTDALLQQLLAAGARLSAVTYIAPIAATVHTVVHELGYDPAGVVVQDMDGVVLDGWSLQYLEPGVSLRLGFDISTAVRVRLS